VDCSRACQGDTGVEDDEQDQEGETENRGREKLSGTGWEDDK